MTDARVRATRVPDCNPQSAEKVPTLPPGFKIDRDAMLPPVARAWTADDDRALRDLLARPDMGPEEIASALRRDIGDVLTRIGFLSGQFGDP